MPVGFYSSTSQLGLIPDGLMDGVWGELVVGCLCLTFSWVLLESALAPGVFRFEGDWGNCSTKAVDGASAGQ